MSTPITVINAFLGWGSPQHMKLSLPIMNICFLLVLPPLLVLASKSEIPEDENVGYKSLISVDAVMNLAKVHSFKDLLYSPTLHNASEAISMSATFAAARMLIPKFPHYECFGNYEKSQELLRQLKCYHLLQKMSEFSECIADMEYDMHLYFQFKARHHGNLIPGFMKKAVPILQDCKVPDFGPTREDKYFAYAFTEEEDTTLRRFMPTLFFYLVFEEKAIYLEIMDKVLELSPTILDSWKHSNDHHLIIAFCDIFQFLQTLMKYNRYICRSTIMMLRAVSKNDLEAFEKLSPSFGPYKMEAVEIIHLVARAFEANSIIDFNSKDHPVASAF